MNSELNQISTSFMKYCRYNPSKRDLNHLLVQNNISGCTVMINKNLLEMVINIPASHMLMHDWWLGLTAAAFGKIGYIDKRMYCYLQRNHSITHTVFSIRKMDYIFLTLEMIDYFKNNNPELIKAAISRHFSACFQVLLMCPLEEVWEKEYNFLIEEIKKYAPTVMRDRNARVRNRLIAMIVGIKVEMAITLCKCIYRKRR